MRILTSLLSAVIAGNLYVATLTGHVVGVHDGDTITLLDTSKTQYKIRLPGVDAPELKLNRPGIPGDSIF